MAGKKGRSGRRKGSLNWSKTPAALAGHYLNDLIETWLAGVPIPTRPDWWLVQPTTGRRHTVPPEFKRALAQAAVGLHPVSFSLRRRRNYVPPF